MLCVVGDILGFLMTTLGNKWRDATDIDESVGLDDRGG